MFFKQIAEYKEKQNHRTNGFTLIEVLIAMSIFAIGILGLAKMQISSINGNASARKFTEAIVAAQSEIESLRLMPFANIKNGSAVTPTGYSVVWTIIGYSDVNGDGINDMANINVVVNDPSGRKRASLNFTKPANM